MPQRLLRRNLLQIPQRRRAERPPRRRDQQPPNIPLPPLVARLPLQTLPNRARLAIHRQHPPPVPRLILLNDFSRHHNRLFIRQRHRLARRQRIQRRHQPHAAHQRHHHLIRPLQRRHFLHRRKPPDAKIRRPRPRRAPDMRRTKLCRLLPQQIHIIPPRQPHHLELPRKSPHNIQRLPPDGAGRPQNHNSFHSPNPATAR